jgi:hemolysin III
MPLVDIETYHRNKPTFRGVVHTYSFYASVPGALYLLYRCPEGQAMWPILIYGVSLILLFGISALYHRFNWSARVHDRIGTLDRVMIYIFIAANFTPFAVFAMDGLMSTVLLAIVWGCIGVGLIVNLLWLNGPNWLHSLLYVVVSGVVAFAFPQLWRVLGTWAVFWIVLGGALHILGATIYATRFPNPSPRRFGFHEVFHCFVSAAIATHYAVVAIYVLPLA